MIVTYNKLLINTHTKNKVLSWQSESNSREPACQARGTEFNTQYYQKKKNDTLSFQSSNSSQSKIEKRNIFSK
jgi:hypothetical protein